MGLDNFNDYYDVTLKYSRALRLQKAGVAVLHMDLCDEEGLRSLLAANQFTDIVNLAAQAGVRHSVTAPQSYVRSNLECFSNLLKLLVEQQDPRPRLLFASSSSVYGPTAKVPFSTRNPTGPPGNVYAATKKANELMARAYQITYGLSCIGLRFFTVYGPWGRPDMAVYTFAEHMAAGLRVPLYDDPGLQRDFTYVGDIVRGIIAVLGMPTAPATYAVYNLGHGVPENVTRLITGLEALLQRKADIALLPVPATELKRTWADISESTRDFGFRPTVGLTEGLQRFCRWYEGYKLHVASPARKAELVAFRGSVEAARVARDAESARQRIEKRNSQLAAGREADLRVWVAFANERGIPLPHMPIEKTFLFHAQQDSPGGDFMRLDTGASVSELARLCNGYLECVGFSSNGNLKKSLRAKKER